MAVHSIEKDDRGGNNGGKGDDDDDDSSGDDNDDDKHDDSHERRQGLITSYFTSVPRNEDSEGKEREHAGRTNSTAPPLMNPFITSVR